MDKKRDIADLLKEMQEYARINRVPIIAGKSAELLTEAVAEKKPEVVLEIGTAIAYSTLLIWQELSNECKIVTIERDEKRIGVAKKFIGSVGAEKTKNIIIIEEDAGEYLKNKLDFKIDFLFLDAGKGQYLRQVEAIKPFLNRGAVIFADNVYFRGMVLNGSDKDSSCPRRFKTIVSRMKEFISYMQDNVEFETNLYQGHDGVLIARYKS